MIEVKKMPKSPKRPCRYPGCPNLCERGTYCAEHQGESQERWRGSATKRGYGAEWRAARRAYLQRYPLCAACMKRGVISPATVVDHVIPHRGDQRLFWDQGNWQPLCKSCHDRKTGRGL